MHAETTLPAAASPPIPAYARIKAASWSVARVVPPLMLILLATTWPITDFQDHPHWDEVEWIPFVHYFGPFDVVANVVLFVPFGLAIGWGGTTLRRVILALMLGLACSLAVEFAQVYSHNRSATVVDLITNTTGAWLGAQWAVARARARLGGSPDS